MKRSRLSGGALVVAALVAAMVASAAYGISAASGVLGEADFKSCISDSGADTCATAGVPLVDPTGFSFNDDQTRLLVAAHSSDAVAVLKRDVDNGELTPLDQSPCISETGAGGCADGRGLDGPRGAGGVSNNVYVASDVSNAVVTITRSEGQSGRWEQRADSKNCITEAVTAGCDQGRALTDASSVVARSFVYVGGANSIAVFKRDKDNGALTQLSGAAGCIKDDGSEGCFDGSIPGTVTDMVITKDGKSLYAVDGTAVHAFSRDKATGQLTQRPDPVVSHGSGPVGIAVDPSNLSSVYVVAAGSGAIDVFSRNKITSDLTQLAAPNGCVTADGSGGQCVAASNLAPVGALARDYVYKTTRFVYVAGANGLAVLLRNKHTGALTPVGPAPAGCTTETGDGITCLPGKGLSGLTDIVTTGAFKHIYVAGTTFDSVVTLRQGG